MAERPFDPERTLFVDDSEYVLEAAEAYGVAHDYAATADHNSTTSEYKLHKPSTT